PPSLCRRCQSYVVGRVESASPRLHSRLRTLLVKNASVRQIVDNYKASLQAILTRENQDRLLATVLAPEQPRSRKVSVTLNGSTAHPRLLCHRSNLCWAIKYQEFPDVPERFDQEFCVLGCEGFTTGWCCWEVSVHELDGVPDVKPSAPQLPFLWGGKARWAIGVAKESIRRKGTFPLSPQEGIWAVGRSVKGEMIAFDTYQQKLSLQRPLQRLRVRLDCEARQVEFLDAETEALLHTCWVGLALGQTLRPFFYLGQDRVTFSM
ncbi:E3 ubiquitin-protein ligase TRIM69-like, partial [Pseudonaja textilis]|uniref:E3 ubiquitin-protein ligase TRIM69-like n=1 Tax=Pseudonaja textilis TaxID=8673 RepID=UPI000EA8DF8A